MVIAPTPTPTSPATPTPPAATLNTGEVKPAVGATFISATMELTTTSGTSQTNGIITGGTTSGRVTTFDTPGFAGSYGATTGYNLSDAVNAVVLGPSQLTGDTTVPNGNGVVFFTRNSGSAVDYLALYQQSTYSSSSKGSGYSAAQYGGTGGWQHTVPNGSNGQTRLNYFAYGSATPVGAMPRSGVVKFKLMASGNYATDTDLWFLPSSSSSFLTVDFAAGTVTGAIGLSGQNFYKSIAGGIGALPLVGNFTGNMMAAPIVNGSLGPSGSVVGQFRLLFVGPSANEVVITYIASDDKRAAVGAIVGFVDPYAF